MIPRSNPAAVALVVDAALVAAFAVSLLALVLAMTTSAGAGQMLVPGYRGPHYVPAYRYNGPPPGSYLNGYVRPYRPNPAPFIAGALLGGLAAVQRPVVLPPPPVDALDDIPSPTTRAEVMDALRDYCELRPDAGICPKIAGR